jgi:hypothetical protein
MRRATRRVGQVVVMLGAAVVLAATSCAHASKAAPGDELGVAIERDGVLSAGVAWRSSMSARTVCVFGATDAATQDRVVEGARESLRRIGGPRRFESLAVEFWSGEPPPPEVQIRNKPAFRPGRPTPDEAEWNAPYAIRRVRTVEIR